jgi:O-antigen/teichoic acid export membrane protein
MRATVVVDRVLRPVLQLVLVGLVLAIGADRGVGIAWAAPWLVGIVLVVATLRRRLPAARPAAVRSLRGDFWRFAAPRALASVAQLLLQRLDIVLVAALRGPVDAAVYTAATRFLVVGQFVNQAITGPVQPRLSSSMASGDSSASRTLYQISTAWVVIISWPIFCAAIVLAPLYLRVFGHGYHGYSGAVTVVVLLAGAMLVASGVGVVDSVIIMAGRSSWNLATTLVALAVNVAVDVALIPHLGIVGAAIGWGAAILASNVVPLIMAWRLLGMHPFGRNVLSACALSVVCFLGIPELAEVVSGDGQLAAAAGTMVGGVLYVVVLLRKHRQFALDAFLPGRFRRRSAEAGATR